MKRKVCLLMVLVSASLVGCGEVSDTADLVVEESRKVAVDVNDLVEAESTKKQELVLAGIDFDSTVLSVVDAFNESSDDTVITVRDYGDGGGILPDDVLNRIYEDAMSEDMPDLYFMSSASSVWPVQLLSEQDVFVDLYPFLQDDSDISKDDFFSSILQTVQQDDMLYCFPVSYALKGIWGMPEYCDSSRFLVSRVAELRQTYPENDMLFGVFSSMDLINMEVFQNLDLYVDYETKTCDFESERFLEVLEAACDMPGYRPAGREEMMDYASGTYLLDGRQLFAPYTVSDFEAYLMEKENSVFCPYGGGMASVTLTDSEVVLDVQSSFAITGSCSNPAAAWQFLRTFLELEYQQSLFTANAPALPVNVHAFSAETDRLLAENKGTKTGFDRIKELTESARAAISSDLQIENIIYEEVSACFSREKTVREVTASIQERVSAYLLEYERVL